MSLDTIEEGYGYWTIYTRPRWWPLMPGPLHEDLEFFSLHALHRHVHPVYLNDREYEAAAGRDGQPHDVWVAPLCRWADPRTSEPGPTREGLDPTGHGALITSTADKRAELVQSICIRTARRKPHRPMPPHPLSPEYGEIWVPRSFKRLVAAYCPDGKPVAAPRGTCPHRGADLTGLIASADGTVTCPQHGLRCRIGGPRKQSPRNCTGRREPAGTPDPTP